MTHRQRTLLMAHWWPDACAAKGWNPADRDLRLQTLSDAVGRQLATANDLDHLTDIDKVRSHLLSLSQPANLSAQVQIANMPATRAQYTIAQLKTEIAKISPGSNYLRKIMQDRFKTTDWNTLTQSQLIQLFATLRNRRQSKLQKAPSPHGVPSRLDGTAGSAEFGVPASAGQDSNIPF